MSNPRDVNLDIIGHDHTGHATRSAGNNLDQLKRKLDKVDEANRRVTNSTKGVESSLGSTASGIRGGGMLAAIAVGLSALPDLAAASAAGIVLALGSGLAAIGIIAASRNKYVKDSFDNLVEHIKVRAPEIGAAFVPVLGHIARLAEMTFDGFVPSLEKAGRLIAPSLDRFTTSFSKAFDSPRMHQAVEDLAGAFADLLDAAGPSLPAAMDNIAHAIGIIAAEVKAHPHILGLILESITALLVGAALLIDILARMGAAMFHWQATVASVLARIVGSWAGAFTTMLRIAANAADVLGQHAMAKKLRTTADAVDTEVHRIQTALNSLHGKTVTVHVTTDLSALRAAQGPHGVLRAGSLTAAAASFSQIEGGAGYRTGGPAMVMAAPTVNTSVFLDGRQIAATVRTTIDDVTARQAHRARVGRR